MVFDRNDIIDALKVNNFEPYRKSALEKRARAGKDIITLRAIIEYTNHCKRLCKYCGLNAADKAIVRYRMSDDEIFAATNECIDAGYVSIVLQGGEDPAFNAKRLETIVKGIAKSGVTVTLSAGEMSDDDYRALYAAGAERYLLKHETANKSLYALLHPDSSLEVRLDRINALKTIGFKTGSGFMVGLPNQTAEDIADDILTVAALDADMAGIGTFIPNENTELKDASAGSAELTLRAIALMRIIRPDINIPATTSLGVAADDPYIAIDYGADVIMRKATPSEYRPLYEIYTSNDRKTDIAEERKEVTDVLKTKGYSCI